LAGADLRLFSVELPERLAETTGDSLSDRQEFLQTGSSELLKSLQRQFPDVPFEVLEELQKIPGIGPVRAEKLYLEYGVKSLGELEQAIQSGQIVDEKLANSVQYAKTQLERIPWGKAMNLARPILTYLKEWEGIEKIDLCGSMRRFSETVKDVDILVAVGDHNRTKLRELVVTSWPQDIIADGPTRTRLRIEDRQVDIIYTSPSCWGACINYLTGCKEWNIKVRERAKSLGLKISEFGAFDRASGILVDALKEEEDLFRLLKIKFVEPTDRTPSREPEVEGEV